MKSDKQPLDSRRHMHLALVAWTAAAEMINGTARREEWDDIADCVNIVEALHEMNKLGAETMHWVLGAIRGLQFAITQPNGQMRMHAAEIVCLKRVIELYDDAIGKFAGKTIEDARARVVRKIQLSRMDPNTDLLVIDR